MKNNFKFCPMCASTKIINQNNIKWFCSDCDFELYSNTASAVGVIIKDRENNVLFEVRAKEPRKGFLCLPGGFVNHNEKAEDAVVRECIEEIGSSVENIQFLCTNPNTYPYKNIEYKTCDIFFTAEIPSRYKNMESFVKSLSAQKSEVQDFKFYKISSIKDIEKIPLAFESAILTLKEFVLQRGTI